MTDSSSTALAFVEMLKKKAPEYLDLMAAESDEAFEDAFDALLEKAIHSLEKNSKNYLSLDEEGLTATLALALQIPGLEVSQESHSNGHVDVTFAVRYCHPIRIKLGEAKIYNGPEYHFKGLNQLLGRYTTGRECPGIMISYVRKMDIDGLMKKLRDRMDKELPEQQQGPTLDHSSDWRFLSRHAHSCGKTLDVGHVGCNLYVPATGSASSSGRT